MGSARIPVSFDLLRQALCLPILTEIEFVEQGDHAAVLYVAHPDLRDVPIAEGEKPPFIVPTFKKQDPVVMIDWGQK